MNKLPIVITVSTRYYNREHTFFGTGVNFMKINKLTPGYNLRWESSRMMLPEHVEALHTYRRQSQKQAKPEMDQQTLDELSSVIQASYHKRKPVRLTVFDTYENKQIVGVVTSIDRVLEKLKFEHDQEFEWIHFNVIMDVSYADE
ncbi:YolD-like family protein [Halalkalibacterium halodurans]|jgi:hypothetical protein|nr:YolD-like family protein [Halalkalibacterium halodurans]